MARKTVAALLFTVVVLGALLAPSPVVAGVAYQECIPEGVGSETSLTSVFGTPNWFAAQVEERNVPVYNWGTPEEDRSIPGITIDANQNLVIDPQSPALGWPITGIFTVPYGQYQLEGGDVYYEEYDGKWYVTEVRAKFKDYVYGTGDDLYNIENTPQYYLEKYGIYSIDKITFLAVANGELKFLLKIEDKVFLSPKLTANGWITHDMNLNPILNRNWKFAEIQNMELGVRLNPDNVEDAKLYRVWIRIKFKI